MNTRGTIVHLGLLTVLLASVPFAVESAPAETTTELQHLRFLYGKDMELQSELVDLTPKTARTLASMALGETITVHDFPVAPGKQSSIVFERVDLYAPDARIVEVTAAGEREIPRSNKVRLLGRGLESPAVRVGLWMNPDGSAMRGISSAASGLHRIEAVDGQEGVFEIGMGAAARMAPEFSVRCDTAGEEHDPGVELDWNAFPIANDLPIDWAKRAATHRAVLAFDTDGELIDDMFGGSTVAAGDGIADMVTAFNVIYERDPQMTILQGHTVLRGDPDSDPWSATTTSTQLDEFGDYWAANMGSQDRVWAMWLSGKSSNPLSGSGRSWIDSYCEKQSYGGSYSVGMVLRGLDLDHFVNVMLMAHELGHTSGSDHTHCYSPVIDECHKGQCGTRTCYCGETVSCPDHSSELPIDAGVGTIMSYCHFTDADSANCPTAAYFHPRVVDQIRARMLANVGPGCVEAIDPSYPAVIVNKSGVGTGVVRSSPGGIYCGGTCEADFLPGINVMLIATADPGSEFVGWIGCGTPCAFATPLFGEKVVTATFGLATMLFSDGFETGDDRNWTFALP